jgi:hypothetical protein
MTHNWNAPMTDDEVRELGYTHRDGDGRWVRPKHRLCECPTGDEILAGLQLNGDTPSEEEDRFFVDWSEFWAKERTASEWLIEPILARGRGHAIYAKYKTGKSLVMLWMACELSQRSDMNVIYLDYEMGEEDLDERLTDLGYGPDSDLSRLRYSLLPALPALDHPEGGDALCRIVDNEQAVRPDSHIVVVIDTIGRAVVGKENDADTFRAFWRSTGMRLKQRGVTWARLDHAGHDDSHQRGSSSKGDDPDVIWSITKADEGGLTFKRDAARMSWVPARVGVVQLHDPLRYVPGVAPTPPGTLELIGQLNDLGVPRGASVRECGNAMRQAGLHASQAVVSAAVRARKEGP